MISERVPVCVSNLAECISVVLEQKPFLCQSTFSLFASPVEQPVTVCALLQED